MKVAKWGRIRGRVAGILLMGALSLGLGSGSLAGEGVSKSAPVRAELQILTPEVTPDSLFSVAIDVDVAPGWHMGPIGDPEEDPNALFMNWQLPEGFALMHLSGPKPEEHGQGDLSWRGYVDHVRLIAEIHSPAQLTSDRVAIAAEMDWVACGQQCVPGTSHLQLDLPARKQAMIGQSLAGAVAAAQPTAPSSTHMEFLGWIGLAFLGGLLLNLMPCVLPVLSLKAVQLMQLAREGRRSVVVHTLAYAVGVVGSFMGLGLVFIAFKSAGVALGWGFQLQSPLFVAGLSGLMLLLGMSLVGVFELGTGLSRLGDGAPRKRGLIGSLLSGALTTLVATPCTGPFLGSAMAFGMTLSAAGQLTIMLAMAFGLVLPFLLLIPFPGLLHRLPKPGPWMERLKQGMGVLLLLSAGWLTWVFAALTDTVAFSWWLIGLVVLAIAAWIYGRLQWVSLEKRPRHLVGLLPVLALTTGVCLWQSSEIHETVAVVAKEHHYSRQRADAVLARGQSVLVDFTARWCLLCQANKPVLHSEEVQRMLAERDVTFMEADLTRRQPELMRELAALGREGVPAYVLLSPGRAPHFLPEVLTEDSIREALSDVPLAQIRREGAQ
jgi:thiol:disulfide interchange protein